MVRCLLRRFSGPGQGKQWLAASRAIAFQAEKRQWLVANSALVAGKQDIFGTLVTENTNDANKKC